MLVQIGSLLDETQARRDGKKDDGTPPPRQTQVFPAPSLDLSNPEIWIVPKRDQSADLQLTATDLGYAVVITRAGGLTGSPLRL